MKITFVVPTPNLSGGIRVLAIYAAHLQQQGHEVVVVSTPQPQPTLRERIRAWRRGKGWSFLSEQEPSHFDNLGVPVKFINRHRPITDSDIPDADVVIATWWETAEWVEKLSANKGVKVYFIQGYESLLEYLPKDRIEATYSLPMHKITVSPALANWHKTHFNNSHSISVVLNSVDTKQFYAPPGRDKATPPTVGMIYSTTRVKGCEVIFKAFSLATQKFPHLRLVAFGTEKISPNLPLPPNTEYVYQPSQTHLKNIYSQCDAWLIGSTQAEGFGLPILEAMACRTPVISTPSGAAPTLLAQKTGMLVKFNDVEDMARAIEQMVILPNHEWQAMSEAAYTTAVQYTWREATQLFEQALYTAIKQHHQQNNSHSRP